MSRNEFNITASDAEGPKELSAISEIDLNAVDYLTDLEGYDMTEDQKIKLLETLWSIARVFVELGFSPDCCGQLWRQLGLDPSAESATDILATEKNTPTITPNSPKGN